MANRSNYYPRTLRLQSWEVQDVDVYIKIDELGQSEIIYEKAGANIVAKAAILAEGDAKDRKDIIFLEALPVF